MAETCANCGAMIGNLETPHAWHDNIVCATCSVKLTAQNAAALPPPPQPAPPANAPRMLDGNLVRC